MAKLYTLAVLLLAVSCQNSLGRLLEAERQQTRSLAGFAACPAGCKDDGVSCAQDGTAGGLRCVACQGNLAVLNNGQCGCGAGRYYSGPFACSSCPKGSYCIGGALTADSQPQQQECPEGMTTLGQRAASPLVCVNLPGYFYVPGNATGAVPSASLCPADTWSRGLRKQRSCVACFPGFTTGGVTGASASTACFVSAGFYVPAGSAVATACPRGTFKSEPGATTSCTSCPAGVTTEAEGSTSAADCTIVTPGLYAAALNGTAVSATKLCPQRFYCPGGVPTAAVIPANLASLDPAEPTIKACPEGTWTQGPQAASEEECMTPPGFFTANGTTSQCPPATYRDEWAPADMAAACRPCGDDIKGSPTDSVAVIDPVTEQTTYIEVQTTSTGCYILPGQGLYRIQVNGRSVFQARNCDSNSYGVAKISYGRTVFPCRDCPANMMTSTDKINFPNSASHFVDNGDGTRGFVNVNACVTRAGFGYASRQSDMCAEGTYNGKDTYDVCKLCPFGTTTAGVGLGVTVDDCKLAPGFGFQDGRIGKCPVGTYNDVVRNDTSSPCKRCPTGTTTVLDGADSIEDCTACAPGYGGPNCATPCGGSVATYGPAGRFLGAECTPCSAAKVGYSYNWNGGMDSFAPTPVARLGASSGYDCLAEFVQVEDAAWHLPYSGSDMVAIPNVATTAACAALCKDNCQFFTYDYMKQACFTKIWTAPVMEGAPFIAFKTEMSGDVGASSVDRQQLRAARAAESAGDRDSVNGTNVQAKALSSGSYVFYQDATTAAIGIQTPAPGAAKFTTMSECLIACDYDNACAGIVADSKVDILARPATCKLVKGDPSPGVFKRSLTRADTSRLQPPARLFS